MTGRPIGKDEARTLARMRRRSAERDRAAKVLAVKLYGLLPHQQWTELREFVDAILDEAMATVESGEPS